MRLSNFDYIIAGAGLSGSTFARLMAEKGSKILVIDRRSTVAGNLYDETNMYGILVQQNGPHIFHTNSEEVYSFITKYHKWNPFKLRCSVDMCGQQTPSPFNFKTIDQFYATDKAELIKEALLLKYPNQSTVTIVELLNSEEPLIKQYAQMLFDNDYSLYTAKQWGIKASEIDINVLKRVPVRLDYKEMYFSDKYECMPEGGFTSFIKDLLDHDNIEYINNEDALKYISLNDQDHRIEFHGLEVSTNCKLVYTGAIDELFNFEFGKLPYRSLTFKYETLNEELFQATPVVAYPQVEGYTCITEYKQLPKQNILGITTIAYEYPMMFEEGKADEPYYPVPTDDTAMLYSKYKAKAGNYDNLILCGRLANYKYYNMDQAILAVLRLT